MKKQLLTLLFAISTLISFSQVPSYVPTNGLVGYWPFNGNAIDESSNTNDGTVNGATLTADRFGNANNAYSFDGVSNYISIPNSVSLSNMTSITISAWFNINQYFTQINQGWFSILSKTNSSLLGKYRLGAYTNVSGQPGFFSNLGTMEANINQNNLYSLNQWNQIIITISNGNYTIYVNGIQIFNGATTLTSSTTDNLPLLIGKDTYGLVDYANGKIDDIGVWNRALDSSEISNLYNGNICYQYITVTDTLIINTNLTGFNPVNYQNTIKIWPNPTNDHITIDYGNYANLNGYQLKINNSVGQQMFQTNIVQQTSYVDLGTWSGNGIYFVHLIDSQGNTVDIRKIVLQ